MSYPVMDESYYVDGNDQNIKRMMEQSYAQALTINQSYWTEADIDMRFKAGDQKLWSDVYGIDIGTRNSRKNFSFNRIRRIVDMVTGYQRKNRKSMIAVPIEGSDEYTADQISKILFWVCKRDSILETISEAFEGAITTGMNLLSVWMDYRTDSVNGDICVDNVGYSSYLIDPYFYKKDLSDCNYLWRRMWKSKKQLEAMFPDRQEEIKKISLKNVHDVKFNFMPQSFNMGMATGLVSLDEYWYLDTRKQDIIEDVKTGDYIEFFGEKEDLKEFVSQDPNRVHKTIYVPTVKLVYCVDGKVFYHGPNPYGHEKRPIDRYPFVPVFAYYEPNVTSFDQRLQGIPRGLRAAQYLYNRRKIIELDILESQVNSGWVFEEDALVDPSDVFMTGQGKGIAVKQGRLGSIQRIQAPDVPPAMIELSRQLGQEIMEISGVNEELLGSATDDKAGVLSMLRQGAGLVTLQKLFDQLDSSQRLLGQIIVDMVQSNFTESKIQRITNQEVSPQFKQKAFQKFDIEITDGLNTSTQRQMQFVQMLEMHNAGIPIAPEDLLEASQIQNKSEIIKNMQQRQQAQAQQAQQQQAVQMEVLKAQIDDLRSRALGNQGLALERAARVESDRWQAIERHSQAIENISDSRLNKAKMLKELESMDIDRIRKLIELSKLLSSEQENKEVMAVQQATPQTGLESLQQSMPPQEQQIEQPTMNQ